jgi:hypothetical protein
MGLVQTPNDRSTPAALPSWFDRATQYGVSILSDTRARAGTDFRPISLDRIG